MAPVEMYYEEPYVYIKKPNGVHAYNMSTLDHNLLPQMPAAVLGKPNRETKHFVPVLCAQCYGSTEADYQHVRNQVVDSCTYLVGMAGTCDRTDKDFDPNLYPSTSKGDLDKHSFPRYHLPYENAKYMCHVNPGSVLWKHCGPEIGTVLGYWHVHIPDSTGVNALVKLTPDKHNRVQVTSAEILATGFSWTTTTTGEKDIIVELSAVNLPARPGCLASSFNNAAKTLSLLDAMHFSPRTVLKGSAPLNDVLELLKKNSTSVPLDLVDVRSRFEDPEEYIEFLTEYALVTSERAFMLEVMYSKKGECVAETHIKKGTDKFLTINGTEASKVIVKNKVLTADTPFSAEPTSSVAQAPDSAAETHETRSDIPPPDEDMASAAPSASAPSKSDYSWYPNMPPQAYGYHGPAFNKPEVMEDAMVTKIMGQIAKEKLEEAKRKREEEIMDKMNNMQDQIKSFQSDIAKIMTDRAKNEAACAPQQPPRPPSPPPT